MRPSVPFTLLAAFAFVSPLASQAGAKPHPKRDAKDATAGAGSHLLAVKAAAAEVAMFLKEHKGEPPLPKLASMQRQALDALQADPKKELRDLVAAALDVEIAIESKDWAAATKSAEEITKAIPQGLEGAPATDTAAGKPGSLESTMKAINGTVKNLAGFLKDPKGEAPLAKVYELQKRALEAKQAEPTKTKSKPEGKQREDFVHGYKKSMRDLIVSTLDLGLAIEKKEWQEANKILSELNKEKEDGHKVYKGPKRGGPGERGTGGEEGGAGPAPGAGPGKKK